MLQNLFTNNRTCFSHTNLTISVQLMMRYISMILDKVANYTVTQLEITLGKIR